MNPSPLLLEGYRLKNLAYTERVDTPNVDKASLHPNDLKADVNIKRDSSNPRKWRVELKIELIDRPKREFPFSFAVSIEGVFEVAADYPDTASEHLVSVNGPSILYSSAREVLASLSGTRSLGSVVLPTVSFPSSSSIERPSVGAAPQPFAPAMMEFGFPRRREEFAKTYARFLRSMPNLKVAWDYVLTRADTRSQRAKVIYGLGRMPLEDELQAIILLCANGYSNTAKMTLLALFRKVVTLLYLNKHSEEIEAFMDYSWIERQEQTERIDPILRRYPRRRSSATKREIKIKYDELRGQYDGGKWAKEDILGMAKDVGIDVGLVELAYHEGEAEAQPKLIAILERIEERDDGSLWWKDELPDVQDSRTTLMLAHYFVLRAFDALRDYFKIDVPEKTVSKCVEDYMESWNVTP